MGIKFPYGLRLTNLTEHLDCFRCLPNHGNEIRRLYIQLLYEISKSNLLEYCLRQITNNPNLTLNKLDDISNEILKSEYALS